MKIFDDNLLLDPEKDLLRNRIYSEVIRTRDVLESKRVKKDDFTPYYVREERERGKKS